MFLWQNLLPDEAGLQMQFLLKYRQCFIYLQTSTTREKSRDILFMGFVKLKVFSQSVVNM